MTSRSIPRISRSPTSRRIEFHQVAGRDYDFAFASYPRLNLGTPTCYIGGMRWPVSPALWLGQRPQARLTRAQGELLSWSRTPHRLHAQVDLATPGRLLWNQNFASGFESDRGELIEDRGRIAVELPAGRQEVTVTYRPSWLWPSFGLSLVGCAVAALWLTLSHLRRTRSHTPRGAR